MMCDRNKISNEIHFWNIIKSYNYCMILNFLQHILISSSSTIKVIHFSLNLRMSKYVNLPFKISAKRRRKNSAHNWQWFLRSMLSHDEKHRIHKSQLQMRTTRKHENPAVTHIFKIRSIYKRENMSSIAYTCRSNVNIRACVRARISYMNKITRGFIREFFSTILLPVLVTIDEDVSSQTTGGHCDISCINYARINHVTKWREIQSSFLSNIVHDFSFEMMTSDARIKVTFARDFSTNAPSRSTRSVITVRCPSITTGFDS